MQYDYSLRSTHLARHILRLLRPHRIAGASKVRLGRCFDGGYVMVDDFKGIQAAYSLGINDDVSWDLDIARRGIPVFQYDHTIPGLPASHPLFHWEAKCISDHADEAANTETLDSLISKNGHEDFHDMILKCDIEGSEWQVLAVTPNATLRRFRQIVLELHDFPSLHHPDHANRVRVALANLTASHRVVHVHANNFSPFCVIGGIPMPTTMEVGLVRLDQGDFAPSDETFPTDLDMPCNPDAADLYLGRFAFDRD